MITLDLRWASVLLERGPKKYVVKVVLSLEPFSLDCRKGLVLVLVLVLLRVLIGSLYCLCSL